MPHAVTISVKTVNIIVQAISGMYEWAIREQLLTINPAKGLSIRDPQPDVEKRDPLIAVNAWHYMWPAQFVQSK
jgi:hypothetical protein